MCKKKKKNQKHAADNNFKTCEIEVKSKYI